MSTQSSGTGSNALEGLTFQPSPEYLNDESSQVRVSVRPIFLDEQSIPTEDHYVWAYQIHITNRSAQVLTLQSRHWVITDATGFSQEIHAGGVVGEFPVLQPGETYEYTSGAALTAPSGIMSGHYTMHAEDGSSVRVSIPAFSLDSPHQKVTLN